MFVSGLGREILRKNCLVAAILKSKMAATRERISRVTHPKIQSYSKTYLCAKFGAVIRIYTIFRLAPTLTSCTEVTISFTGSILPSQGTRHQS
jgi:hypothetical protein